MRTTIKILALTTIIFSSTSVLANEHYRCKTEHGKEYTADVNWELGEVEALSGSGRHHRVKFAKPDANGVRDVVSYMIVEGGTSRVDIVSAIIEGNKTDDVLVAEVNTRDGNRYRHTCKKDK